VFFLFNNETPLIVLFVPTSCEYPLSMEEPQVDVLRVIGISLFYYMTNTGSI